MRILQTSIGAIALLASLGTSLAKALPPPEDIPEEVLRTEIILEARSPLNGEPLPAAEYEQLQETLSLNPDRTLSPTVQELIFLLQIRRVLKPIIPLIP